MSTDAIDDGIIALLSENGRLTHNEIAKQLDVSEGTVRNRIKKLVDTGLLCVKGLLNPELIPEKQIIFLGVKVKASKDLEKAAESVVGLSDVISVSIISGRYDLLVEVFIEPGEVINFISRDLAKQDAIMSTESFLTLKSYNKWV